MIKNYTLINFSIIGTILCLISLTFSVLALLQVPQINFNQPLLYIISLLVLGSSIYTSASFTKYIIKEFKTKCVK